MRHVATIAIGAVLAVCLPAGAAAVAAENANLLLNPGAEDGKGDQPSVWFAARVPAEGLKMYRDFGQFHSGKASLAISCTAEYKEPVANNWAQQVQETPKGKVVTLTAFIRTEDADGANVCVQCWDVKGENMLAFASTPEFRGDQDWIRASASPVQVPDGTAFIIVRAVLGGRGKAWFDDISLVETQAPSAAKKTQAVEAGLGVVPPSRGLAEAVKGIVRLTRMTKDCMVLSYMGDWNHGTVDNVAVANNDGGVRTLFEWDYAQEIAPKQPRKYILAAYSRKTTSGRVSGQMPRVEAYEILSDWPERTSWKTQPKYAEKPFASFQFTGEKGWKLFDVTDFVRKAKGGGTHGMMLRFDTEDKSADDWSGYAFVSREGTGEWEEYRPVLLTVETESEKK